MAIDLVWDCVICGIATVAAALVSKTLA